MASRDAVSSDGIDLKMSFISRLYAHSESGIFRMDHMQINAVFLYYVYDPEHLVVYRDSTCVVYLSAACSVERCGLEYNEFTVLIEVADKHDLRIGLFFCISEEFRRIEVAVFRSVSPRVAFSISLVGAGELFLSVHVGRKAFDVYGLALFFKYLLSEFERESVCIVELEREISGKYRGSCSIHIFHVSVEDLHASVKCL